MSKPTKRAPGQLRRPAGRRRQQTDLDDLLALFHGPLSGEAAAPIAEFLTALALQFENAHFSTIRRHYQSIVACREQDPRQMELFPLDPPF